MNNYSPIYTFKGDARMDTASSDNNGLVRRVDVAGLSKINAIHSGSTSFLEIDNNGELKFTSTKLTSVTVDNSAVSIAAWITANATAAGGMEQGDVVILSGATGGAQTWMCSTNAAGSAEASDFSKIEGPLTSASVAATLSGGAGIAVNTSGEIALSAADTSMISENSANLYFTNSRGEAAARSALSANSGITFNSSNGVISQNLNTSQISENSANLFYTNARVHGAISVESAGGLTYDGSGEFSIDDSYFRKKIDNQTLVANTWLTVQHDLSSKYVHVSAYDSADSLIHLDVELVDGRNVKVKASDGLTGVTIVCSK